MMQMTQATEEFGGTGQAISGDAISAYFGIPRSREDDLERAVRTGLRILEVVGEYATDVARAWSVPDFAVRIGIATVRGRARTRRRRGHRRRRRVGDRRAHHARRGSRDDRRPRGDGPPARAIASRSSRSAPFVRGSFRARSRVHGRRSRRRPNRTPRPRPLVGREHEIDRLRRSSRTSRPEGGRLSCS